MKAGSLNHRIEVQAQQNTFDDIGQPSTSWETAAQLWANVRYVSGLSAIKSGADTSVVKASIRVRHGSFNAGQRVLHGGKVFDVQAVLPDGKREFVDLVCEVINGASNA